MSLKRIYIREARRALMPVLLCSLASQAFGQASPFRGLWVGQVKLKYVNEVSVPLDENNVPIAPDPKVPAPTADEANLRLILHVNGAGQVTLLKDVAILNRKGNTTAAGLNGRPVNLVTDPSVLNSVADKIVSDSDVALVTDERLYTDFPAQPAIRVASAVFDFGDSRATDALNDVVSKAANAVGSFVFGQPASAFNSAAAQKTVTDSAALAGKNAAAPSIGKANVATAYDTFLRNSFDSTKVNAIADATTSGNAVTAAAGPLAAALAVQSASFYNDSRPVQAVNGVLTVVQTAIVGGANQAAKRKIAQNTAANYADVADNYQRFLAGKVFGDMIAGAASAASAAAVVNGATATSIRNAVTANSAVIAARSQALTYRVSLYDDTRSPDAAELVLTAVINSAASALPAMQSAQESIRQAADQAGRNALANNVPRFAVPIQTPTLEYNNFVTSAAFQSSPEAAGKVAAAAAVSERVNNPLYTQQSIINAALVGAVNGLQSTFAAAAQTIRTELPLTGNFGPGRGDPRLTYDVKKGNLPPLGAAALEGTLFLPESHPTNPFRHRRHPDHTVGFDLMRKLRLDFNGSQGDPLGRAGFGVDRITGTYREEVFGLHKPLGPNKDVGLKVEGTFELTRISLIDTVNAR